jgi:hypothetical protein
VAVVAFDAAWANDGDGVVAAQCRLRACEARAARDRGRRGRAEETTFADVGAFAWYLRAVPWAVDGFSIEMHRPQLERLHRRLESDGPLVVSQPAFWLAAERGEEL